MHVAQPPQGDIEKAIADMATRITIPGKATLPFRESEELRQLRRDARSLPPGPLRRQAWKSVFKMSRRERNSWQQHLREQAVKLNWVALHTLEQSSNRKRWEHALLDDPEWQRKLQLHFGESLASDPWRRWTRPCVKYQIACAFVAKKCPGKLSQGKNFAWPRRRGKEGKVLALMELVMKPSWQCCSMSNGREPSYGL